MKKILLSIFISIMGCAAIISVNAQPDSSYLVELNQEEQNAVNALVLYPENTRSIILKASLHPEALIRMESIQSKTADAFKSILQPYPQSLQATLWDLTRYPKLIERLSAQESMSTLLPDYPEVLHPRIREVNEQHLTLVRSIHQLNLNAIASFEATWQDYPAEDQRALRELMDLPEVLNLLTEHIRLTIIVGDLYKTAPGWLLQKADSLHLVLAREQAQELENWKKSIEDNPEVLEELKASSADFEAENSNLVEEYYDYDDEDYFETVEDDLYYDDEVVEERVVHHYYHYHYPYWLGYPYWYTYPRWRPYPVWWDWGFYWGPHRSVVVFNLPSFHFTHWYFYHPHHHYHYPHLSAHFVNHYYGHRSHGSSISASVNGWVSRNQAVVSQEWLRDDKRLVNRFEEYGKSEMARKAYNDKNPRKALTQAEYIGKNKNRYPALNQSIRKNKTGEVKVSKEPARVIPRKSTLDKPSYKAPKNVVPKVRKPSTKRAQDYHRNAWEKTRKQTIPKATRPSIKSPRPTVKTPPKRTKTVRKPKKPNG